MDTLTNPGATASTSRSGSTTTSARLALVFSIATVVVWTAKAVAIGIAGGLGRSPVESPLFLLGLACFVVAAPATGVAIAGRRSGPRPAGRKVVGGVLGAVAMAVVGIVTGLVVSAVEPSAPGWAWEEANLWAMMLTLLAVNLAVRAPRR